jgi:membrane protease YdiL (CAAX protease family)
MEIMPMQPPPAASKPTPAAAIGLCLALLFGLVPFATWIAPGKSTPGLLAHEAVWWALALILLLWLHYVERLPFLSIGLRKPTGKTILYGVLAGIVLIAIMIVHFAVIIPMFHLDATHALAEKQAIMGHPLWYRLLMVLRAAVVEEILFRGYMIEKVRQLTGSTALAVVVSAAVFTYAHLSGWGAVHLIPVCAAAIVFALLYIWRRDLPCNMIGHFIVDGVGFLFA